MTNFNLQKKCQKIISGLYQNHMHIFRPNRQNFFLETRNLIDFWMILIAYLRKYAAYQYCCKYYVS